ncbi:MAG: BamA/TamA family outer membrane protein [Armatimonadetes bacterium]|nr:BamA/TamA family outer membrane protein [Armatimonadota bacterium]
MARSLRAAIARVLIVALVLSNLPAGLCAQESKVITEIEIIGNKNIGREAIMSVVQEKPGTPFDQAKMQADRAAIEKLGYFSAVSAREEDAPGGAKVIFEVVENPKITKIEFSGNTVVTRQELLEAMRLKEGEVYNFNTFDQDARSVEDLYAKKGAVAYITDAAEMNPETGVLTLPILEFRVSSINFEGLKKTKPWVLKRLMKTKPGDIYNAQLLNKDITRVYESDMLDTQEFQKPVIKMGENEGTVDITIPVKEKKTGQVSVGLGYSSLQKVVGRVELSETNFQGKGLGLNALYEVSGTGTGPSYEMGFYNPFLRQDGTSLSLRYFNKEIYRFSSSFVGSGSYLGNEADYRERRKGASAGLSKPFGQKVRGFATLRTESVNTYVKPGADLTLPIFNINEDYRLTSVALKGAIDSRDFALDPAAGSYYTLTLEPGIADIDNRKTHTKRSGGFTKIDADLRRYFSAGGAKQTIKDKRRTFAVRLQLGITNGAVPFAEQFFVGGAERLRGYREDRFWGDKMLLTSVEYRVPLSGGLSGVLFADYGDAWGGNYQNAITNTNEFTQSNGFQGHLGVGAGVRVSTPIGNLRFDYGFGDEGSRTHFSIGQAF